MSGMLRGAKGSAPFRSGSGGSGSPLVGNVHSKSAVNASNSTSGLGLWPNISGSGGGGGSSSTSFSSSQQSDSSMHANLGLHSAAASGNIGLVKFALDNGQPHTSVLNGLLPLHAACSGGNEAVVRMLLAYGADVNAPRLRMQRGPSGGSVAGMGAEGSTPLHFAAANGHAAIVRILLDHGARPVAKDKEGMTPEALAIAQHQSACVSLLRNCIALYGPGGLAGPSAAPDYTQSPAKAGDAQGPSDLRAQRSFESLSSAAAGVKASLKHHRKQALAKVSSNPNLKSNSTHASNASPPPPLPISLSARNGLEAANGGGSTHSTPPNTLSSSSQQQPRDSKRRPSLPSIFEKASHPASAFRNALLAQPSSALSHPSESVEEVTQDEEAARVGTKQDLLSPPSANASRPTLRLQAKKSLTGLLSKASSGSASESSSPTDVRARISPDVAPSKGTSAFAFLQEKATTPSLASTMNRNRSGSSDLIGQPSPHSLFRSDVTSASSHTSPTSSVENFDAINRATGGAALTFRPRKSSNLMTTSSPLAGQMYLGAQHQAGKDARDLRPEEVEQGVRKRSQSTTSVPRRPSLATLVSKTSHEGRSTPPLHPTIPSGRNRVDLDGRADLLDATSEHPARSRTPTMNRYASQPGGSRSNRSPLLPSRHLVEERGDGMPMLPPSPSLSLHQLHSQHSSSSLVSSASSSHATNRRPSRQSLRGKAAAASSSIAGAGMLGGEEVVARARSGRSPSRSEGVASKASSSSLRTHTGLSSQEQALAILRSAEEASKEGTQINLTQMLAAYGEALAQERNTLRAAAPSSSPQRVDKQSSATLLNSGGPHRSPASMRAGLPRSDSSLSPSTSYRMDPHASPQTTPSRPDRGTASTSSRSLSSLKVSDSPLGVRSPSDDSGRVGTPSKDASSTAALRAQTEVAEAGGTLQVGTANPLRLEASEEMSPDEVATSHRHSPSLPTELWAASANSTETTPRSRGRMNQHRSTTSDPHSSAQEKMSLNSPEFLQHIHKTASVNELRFRPDTPSRGSDLTLAADEKSSRVDMTGGRDEGGGLDDGCPVQFAAAYREAPRTIVHDPSHSPVPSGKRKGSVKTFLHNIKSNVVK